jgi:hypothetical protein
LMTAYISDLLLNPSSTATVDGKAENYSMARWMHSNRRVGRFL